MRNKIYVMFCIMVAFLMACAPSPLQVGTETPIAPIPTRTTAAPTTIPPTPTTTLIPTSTLTPTPTKTNTPTLSPTPTKLWNDQSYSWKLVEVKTTEETTPIELKYVVDDCLRLVFEWMEGSEKMTLDQIICSAYYTKPDSDKFYTNLSYNINMFEKLLKLFRQLPSTSPQWLQEHNTVAEHYRYALFYVRDNTPNSDSSFYWASTNEAYTAEFYQTPLVFCCYDNSEWLPKVYLLNEDTPLYALYEFDTLSPKGYDFMSMLVWADNAQAQTEREIFLVQDNSDRVAVVGLESILNGHSFSYIYKLPRGSEIIGSGPYNSFEVTASLCTK